MNHLPYHAPIVTLLVATTLLTLGMAAAVLRWHAQLGRRERGAARQGDALALEFATFLCGRSDDASLRARATAAPPEVFWTALEVFADNIEGEQWRQLTIVLKDVPAVGRARDRLGRGSAWSRALAARHLGLIEDPTLRRPLFKAMQAGPTIVTLSAGLALARLGDTASLEWLLLHPESLAGLSRQQLVGLIKRFGPEALESLRRVAGVESSMAPFHLAAIDALGVHRDELARPLLERLLASGETEARVAAARALGQIASPASFTPLLAGLTDHAWQVRAQAAHALGALGTVALPALPALVARTKDLSWWVRRHAAYSLGRLGLAGATALASIAESATDPYARGAAHEVLQALEWEHDSPGGVARAE